MEVMQTSSQVAYAAFIICTPGIFLLCLSKILALKAAELRYFDALSEDIIEFEVNKSLNPV